MLELDILPIPMFNLSADVPIALLILNAPAVFKQKPHFIYKREQVTADSRPVGLVKITSHKYRQVLDPLRLDLPKHKRTGKQTLPPIKSSHHPCLAHVL